MRNKLKIIKLLFNNTDYTKVVILENIHTKKIYIKTYRKFFGGTQFIFKKGENYNNCYKLVNQIVMNSEDYFKCKNSINNKNKLNNLCAFNVGVKENGSLDKIFRNNNENYKFYTKIYNNNNPDLQNNPDLKNNQELQNKKNTFFLLNSLNNFN